METLTHTSLDRADVVHAIEDIAAAIQSLLHTGTQNKIDLAPGATVFFAHLSRAFAEPKYRVAALEAARMAGDLLTTVAMSPHLYGGVAGVAWPLAHLERLSFGEGSDDLSAVDDFLVECVSEELSPHYDLISGIVGLGVYFVERLPAQSAVEGLTRVLRRLEATAEHDDHGMRWLTLPKLVPPNQRANFPAGKYDLGLAHGVPGVISLLARVIMEGVNRDPAEHMLRETLRWMIGLQRTDRTQGAFGVAIDPRTPRAPLHRRAAWCYGDPGIAVALTLSARALGNPDLHRRARDVAAGAAELAAHESDRVVDMSLCHGSGGLAHLFGVLATTFDDEALRGWSYAWHAKTLALRRPGEGIAGFYYSHWQDGARKLVPDASFLQGAPGVGLSLLSALDDKADRSWDRLLLLS